MAYEAYVDSTYYTGTYKGATVPTADVARLALRATDEVDALTQQGITISGGLATFSETDQTRIKRATCILLEWLAQEDALTGGTGVQASSERVGGYNYTLDATEVARARKMAYARAVDMLLYTGLLYTGGL